MAENLEEIVNSAQDTFSQEDTARIYRRVADKLDEVLKDCRIAHFLFTTAGIVGGILTIVAALTKRSVPRYLMLTGMAIQAAGAVANVGTNMVQASIISTEIKKAKDYLKDIRKSALTIKDRKDQAKFLTTSCLAFSNMELPAPIKKLFQKLALSQSSDVPKDVLELAYEGATAVGEHGAEIVSGASRSAACEGATAVGEHGAEIVSGASGSAVKGVQFREGILFFNVFFLLLDVIYLVFTVRDIVEDKGSDEAEIFRQHANKLERECQQVRKLNAPD